jgi:hypothetical protein
MSSQEAPTDGGADIVKDGDLEGVEVDKVQDYFEDMWFVTQPNVRSRIRRIML